MTDDVSDASSDSWCGDIGPDDIRNVIVSFRSPSGILSCGVFVGNDVFGSHLIASFHGVNEAYKSVPYDILKTDMRNEFPTLSCEQLNQILTFIEANNVDFVSIMESEENPILRTSTLGENFPFSEVKDWLEKRLEAIPNLIQCEAHFQESTYYAVENWALRADHKKKCVFDRYGLFDFKRAD